MNRARFLYAPVYPLLAMRDAPPMKRLVSITALGGAIGTVLLSVAAFAAVFMSLAAGPPGDPWGDWLSRISGELFALSRVCVLVALTGGVAYLALYVDWHTSGKEQPPRQPENNLLD
jgi:hypothetical protein